MIPYVVVYGLMFGAVVLSQKNTDKKQANKIYMLSFALLWIALLALRHPSIGGDLGYVPWGPGGNGYLQGYYDIGQKDALDVLFQPYKNYERGYAVMNWVLNWFSSNYRLLLVVCAVIPITVMSIWIYKNSVHPFLSTLIYLGLPCFVINFSTLRQVIALSITVCAFHFLKKRDLLPFIAMVILAAGFHKSALVFLFAYPIYWFKMNRTLRNLTLAVPMLVFLLKNQLFKVMMILVGWGGTEPDNNGAVNLFLIFYAMYIYTVVFASDDSNLENGTRNLFFVAVCVQAMGGVYTGILRLGYYFIIYAVLLIPEVLEHHRLAKNEDAVKNYTMIYCFIALCFTLNGLRLLQTENWWAMVIPYRFLWQ